MHIKEEWLKSAYLAEAVALLEEAEERSSSSVLSWKIADFLKMYKESFQED